jgi:hypothetical protein
MALFEELTEQEETELAVAKTVAYPPKMRKTTKELLEQCRKLAAGKAVHYTPSKGTASSSLSGVKTILADNGYPNYEVSIYPLDLNQILIRNPKPNVAGSKKGRGPKAK